MKHERYNYLIGASAIIVGVIFLFDNFNIMPDIFEIRKLWPLFVILGGLFVIFAKDDFFKK